ncbi:MAG: DUF4815 domain-containing protein [Minisyncoccia bacterium]
MPQETNLNVSPYFDDFDPDKDYYKVLFKPGYPIQARELTTLQSILQNQVEQYGKHIFKEGSVVIPGQLRYENPLYAVEIESTFNGSPISLYFNEFIGKKLRGSISGVTAEVVFTLTNIESERKNYTLYLKYLQSGGEDFTNRIFQSGETLLLESSLSYNNFTIQSGQGACNTITTNATSEGSGVSVAEGVYFVRGTFARVSNQTILLDQYSTKPSYKIGFDVIEEIVTSDEDESLFDNAQGFSNYAAPGADRFKITLELTKKNIDDLETNNFVEILRVEKGVPQFFNKNPQYNLIRDELARRTFDESGNYFVKPFTLFVRDSLNDRILNDGIYFKDQKTVEGNNPSEDLMVYQIGPGKAYVSGYDVETIAPRLIDVPKTRTTEKTTNQVIPYNAGTLFVVNNSYGTPTIGIGTDSTVTLMDSRIGESASVAAGTTIGLARVYDFIPESSYVDNTSRLNLRLFDIQTYTILGLTTSFGGTGLSTPCFIEGKKSRATGYLKESISGSNATLTLYETTGNFLENEQIIINGIDNGRLINSVTDYNLSDVKSVYYKVGSNTFNADLVLSGGSYIAKPGTTFKIDNGVVSAGLDSIFNTFLKAGDIVSYANTTFSGDPIYNKVLSVGLGGTSFTLTGITTVSGVCNGVLPPGSFEVTNIIKITPSVDSTNSSLLTKLSFDNIESVNFQDNRVIQRRSFNVSTFSGNLISISIDPSDTDVYFDSFDEDRFMITYSDGTIEPIRSDQYYLVPSGGGKQLQFNGLTKSSGTNAIVIATVRNIKPNSKSKKFNKVSSLVVSNSSLTNSGIGTTSLNDGLTYSAIYGTRVQDKQISLNVPDVVRVLAVYESNNSSTPSLPTLQISGNPNNNKNFVIGETIEGQDSGAVAIIVNKFDSDKLEYVYLNTIQFSINELIIGNDSKEEAIISNKTLGDKNITQNFIFDDGQRDTFYDYSRIIRKNNIKEPSRKLKIIFQNYTIDSSDNGEFITANSYSSNNFKYDVSLYKNSRLTDYIDIRPRVAPYTSSSKSPFEFSSRNFASDGQYSKYTLCPGENLILSYSYYVGRIDRVFLNSDGTFDVVEGEPNISPLPPPLKSNSLDIATVFVPPYVYNVKNINVDMSKHKRYRMSDISLLEDRIQRVEKFTTLSMLESKTENFTIKDAETGLDRFKCGFFVDNFSSHEYHDLQNPIFKSCIDTSTNTLRPLHYTTSIDLQLGSEAISGVGQTYNPNVDQSYVTDLGSPNIKKTGDLITLDYNEVQYFEQPYASKTESVTPFLVRYWQGSLVLNPPIDSWIEEKSVTSTSYNEITDVIERDDQNITKVENVTVNKEVWTNPPITNTGVPAFDWINNAKNLLAPYKQNNINSYWTYGFGGLIGVTNNISGSPSTVSGNLGAYGQSGILNGNTIHLEVWKSKFTSAGESLIRQLLPPDVANTYITAIKGKSTNNRYLIDFTPGLPPTITESRETTTTTNSTSNTTTLVVPPEIITEDTTSESISHYTETVQYLRSRNIEFDARGLRPVTRFYSFFEGIDIKNYIIPKLLEIQMISGKFQIGETIETDPHFTSQKIRFRLCKPNHKTGPFDGSNQTDIYKLNPYTQQLMPQDYSESSTFLNVDTRSLELPSEVEYYGMISANMTLIGKTSGAVAKISNIRLISDNSGRLIGSLYIPDPNIPSNPRWINGQNTFTLIDTPTLENLGNVYQEFISNTRINESSAQSDFSSSALSNVTETSILTTRNITILSSYNVNTTTITNTTTNTTTVTQDVNSNPNQVTQWETHDPLAQSFYVRENTGIFLTSVEVFFETKDDSIPVTLQIRPMIAGVPSNIVVPFSEVTLSPDEVNLSTNGSISTKFTFPSPVYLPGPQQLEVRQAAVGSQQTSEFAIVLLSNSPQYRVFIAELGKNDIQTGIKLSAQPTLGSLFKSQNGSTWSPAQLEDLKYRIHRADFVNEGLVRFFNPKLDIGNKKVTVTGSNQILPLSKRIIVGLGSTGYNTTNVVPGVTLVQGSASGKLIGIAGGITSGIGLGVTITNPGFGYTSGTFTNILLETETGSGKGAAATIGVTNAGIATVTITDGGFGYQIGDSLLIPETGMGQNVGFGGKLTVVNISSNNTFIVDNVQGQFLSGITTISYISGTGTTTITGTGVTISSIFEDDYYDGLHMKVLHMNHGMHSSENYVRISSFRPLQSEVNSKLTSSITNTSSTISVISSSGFETFEGLPVSNNNPGYVIIGDEVISYTTPTATTLPIISRGIDGTQSQSYDTNVPVYKYEFNGVSLRRINKVHNLTEVNTSTHSTDLNSYFIKIDNSDTDFDNVGIGSNRPDLYFKETIQSGSTGTVLTNNIQFEAITPNVSYIIPGKTNLGCKIRTFTGTSVSGNEKSFIDDGFKSIPLNGTTYFDNPKLICSDINEQKFITESPGNKSFTMEFLMTTQDSRVSPVIDTIRVNAILTSNLINSPYGVNENSDYANDDTVRSLYNDKHAVIYVSKPVRLKIPANSIKVLLSASRNDTNDIRVLYQLFRDDAPQASQNYELFPGSSNYQIDGQGIKRVVDSSLNDGSSDTFVRQTSDSTFRDYEYSVDDLPDFNVFAIKIVMSGTNQATPPLVRQLRAIATTKPRI